MSLSLERIPPEAVSVDDFEAIARQSLPGPVYDYVAGAAADELTLRANRDAYARIRLRPRVLVDVSRLDTRANLFGQELPFPALIAPTAFHRLLHHDGECATALAAAATGVPYVISSSTTTPLADIAAAAPDANRWFQLYFLPDRARTAALVHEAESAGVRALCLTVDTPVIGTRNREQRSRVQLPAGVTAPYFHHIASHTGTTTSFQVVTWKDVDWLRQTTALPVLLKGILTADDARLAVDHDVAGIVVSNHGGRNLDTVPATIEALPEVVAAVAGRIPVLIDGGIRRGTDMVKALALGASAVLIGRPVLYGLAVGGADGVTAILRILRAEFESALALTGRPVAAHLDPTVCWP
ncbi:MAG TPA: alpha-hydroxy acid oxidase [Gemmatimonadaceae bacterium]|nr:alpha-hydroxy acid oxidase [Gemmatimonadaceae bacterium]